MPTEVLSGLWFGSIDDLKHPMFFDDMNINIIVNLNMFLRKEKIFIIYITYNKVSY